MWNNLEGICFEEKMLWAGVLRRAVFDYVLYKGKSQHEKKWRRAHKFIFGDETDTDTNLSFEEICAVFGWEPDYVRRVVKEMDRGDVKKLESTKFRDDFEANTPPTDTTQKWDQLSAPLPSHFVKYLYSKDYRSLLTLRLVKTFDIPRPLMLKAAG